MKKTISLHNLQTLNVQEGIMNNFILKFLYEIYKFLEKQNKQDIDKNRKFGKIKSVIKKLPKGLGPMASVVNFTNHLRKK